jgi:hypothetical protein
MAAVASNATKPKFEKPKILLIEMDQKSIKAVRDAGFSATIGSFGTPAAAKVNFSLALQEQSASALAISDHRKRLSSNASVDRQLIVARLYKVFD